MFNYALLVLSQSATAGHHGHGSSKKVDESIFKKSENSNQCFIVDDVAVECPVGYQFVSAIEGKKGIYEYCEAIDVMMPTPRCPVPATEVNGACYVQDCNLVCPVGFSASAGKKKGGGSCFATEILQAEAVCPFMYDVVEGSKKKGDRYCKALENIVTIQCPEGTVETEEMTCLGTEHVLPGVCPEGFEPVPGDEQYCFREVERPCDDKKGDKKHSGHHRRLEGYPSHYESTYSSGHHSGHQHDYHYVSVDMEEDHHHGHGQKVKTTKPKAPKLKKTKQPKKEAAYGFTRLVEESYCIYEEYVPAHEQTIDVIVAPIEVHKDVVQTAPIEYICPSGFDLSYDGGKKKKSSSEPVCVSSMVADPVCPDGTVSMGDCCVTEVPFENYCAAGTLPEDGFCVSSMIAPPTYRWMLERECEGFECRQYYENSCVSSHH